MKKTADEIILMYCFAYMIVIIIIIIITNIFNPGLKHFRRYKKETTTTAKQNKTNQFFHF